MWNLGFLTRAVVQFAGGLEFGAQFVESVDDDAHENQREDDGESGTILFWLFDWCDWACAAKDGGLRGIRAPILKRANRGRDIRIARGSVLGAATRDAKRKRRAGAGGDERRIGIAGGRSKSAIVAEIFEELAAALVADFGLFGESAHDDVAEALMKGRVQRARGNRL